jgi:anti-anti-sigma factor
VRTRDMRIEAPERSSGDADEPSFTLRVSKRRGRRVVQIGGELDIATRNRARQACLEGRSHDVVVEMADVTFMDCCGYGGLVAARKVLQADGGSLTLNHQTGQPAELLVMLAVLEPDT